MLTNNRILITGGTGSLGKELTRTLIGETEIVIYSRNEERQYATKQEFKSDPVRFLIGDVRDQATLQNALRGCDIAIHAAAMKDLIMCEDQPTQTYLNNITGSHSFIQAVQNSPTVKRACGISTDKAASPSSVYGSSKYIMEKMFLEANSFSDTIFSAVRFGNMIDSSGSLVSEWKNNSNGTLKLTHPEVARFFFTVKDAALTVIHAIEMATGGEIFIKKMKKVKIYDLLRILTGKDQFEIIGLFPGEKIHEELVSYSEASYCHENGDYYVLKHGAVNPDPPRELSTENAEAFDEDELKALLHVE